MKYTIEEPSTKDNDLIPEVILTITSKKELQILWHRLNMSDATFCKNYDPSYQYNYTKTNNIEEHLWHVIDNAKNNLGIDTTIGD